MTIQENLETIKHCSPTIKKQFVRLLISELIDSKYLTSDIELTANNYELLISILPIYFETVDQKFSSIAKIEILFNEFCRKSPKTELLISSIFESIFVKLEKLKISWEYEQDIEPIDRFILIQNKIHFCIPTDIEYLKRKIYDKHSKTEFEKLQQEFALLLNEKDNRNLLSVGINYSYGNVVLPKTYDIIFDKRDLTKFWEQKTIVKYAFNYRHYFHTELWRGHHSHCLIEVIGDIPEIFNELTNSDEGITLHKGIGLCTKYDWQYIKENNCA